MLSAAEVVHALRVFCHSVVIVMCLLNYQSKQLFGLFCGYLPQLSVSSADINQAAVYSAMWNSLPSALPDSAASH